jgi:hypothetical protein
MKFREVEHLFRLAAIFAVGVLVFAIARAELVPEDFGRFGHYRASAVDEARLRPVVHAGQKACAECHGDVIETRAVARHKALSCETCHGPLAKHAAGEDDAKVKIPEVTALCIRCHAEKTGKPTRYPRVDVKDHAGDEKCVPCHKPHNPKPE